MNGHVVALFEESHHPDCVKLGTITLKAMLVSRILHFCLQADNGPPALPTALHCPSRSPALDRAH